MYYVGIDLGGTNIVAAVVDEKYNILTKCFAIRVRIMDVCWLN